MNNNLLQNLGISPEENKLYINMLSSGSVTAGDLAKQTGLPRPSVYTMLARLITKGLVTESRKDGKKFFVPIHPDKIVNLFEEKKKELELSENEFKKSLTDIRSLLSDYYVSPKLEVFDTKESLERVLKDMLLYKNIETEALWPIQTMVDTLSPRFFDLHNRERIKRNISVRAIWPENQVINFKKHPYLGSGEDFNREIRIAPGNIDFSMGYWIYGKKIAFLSSRQESFGFIIESAELAKTLRSQFDIVWKQSRAVKMKQGDVEKFVRSL
ncbi:MAG: helix-turn-helix domain-containing protein [Candidatus Paceibacterota bacterium]